MADEKQRLAYFVPNIRAKLANLSKARCVEVLRFVDHDDYDDLSASSMICRLSHLNGRCFPVYLGLTGNR
jgi:hypothetical protein